MNKRAIAILGAIFLLIVGTLGVIIYLRKKSTSTTQQTVNNQTEVEQQSQVEIPQTTDNAPQVNNQAVKLTDEVVITPALFFQGNGITYFNKAGQLFQTDLSISGNTVLLSNKRELTIPGKSDISKILWPLVGNAFVAESGSGSSRTWSVYDGGQGAYNQLPGEVKSLDWMPNGDKIAFTWVDSKSKTTINIANPDTSGYQTLTELYEPDNEIKVSPDGQLIAFYRTQTIDLNKNVIATVGIDGKTFKAVVKDGYNTGVVWSPDSKKFLFNKRDPFNQKMSLWVTDVSTGETKNTGVVTSYDKAIWSKDGSSIYAAVPNDSGQDTLFKINISSGDRKEFSPGIDVKMQELFYNLEENVIFFKNSTDGFLYYMIIG